MPKVNGSASMTGCQNIKNQCSYMSRHTAMKMKNTLDTLRWHIIPTQQIADIGLEQTETYMVLSELFTSHPTGCPYLSRRRKKNMRLIDADSLYNTIIDEIDPISIRMDGGEMRGMMRTIIAAEPTIDAVPIKAISAWLAAYADPPKYALEMFPENGQCLENTRAAAWEHHIRTMIECGLMEEENDPE